jgi:hypothetical protein
VLWSLPVGQKMASFGWLPSIKDEDKTFNKSCGTNRGTFSSMISIHNKIVMINRWWHSIFGLVELFMRKFL